MRLCIRAGSDLACSPPDGRPACTNTPLRIFAMKLDVFIDFFPFCKVYAWQSIIPSHSTPQALSCCSSCRVILYLPCLLRRLIGTSIGEGRSHPHRLGHHCEGGGDHCPTLLTYEA